MTDNDRLEALKAKVEGMGFELRKTCVFGSMDFNEDLQDYEIVGDRWRLWFQEDNSDIAETLLAALDPKAVRVRICNEPGDSLDEGVVKCDYVRCDMWNCPWSTNGGRGDACDTPGPNCPGPAKPGHEYVLVERKVMQ